MNGCTHLSPRRKAYDRALRALLYFCAGLTCALLVFIIGYIFYRGLPNISWELLSTETSYINDTIGILPNILNTLYIILLAMIIVLPLGVGAAIYLTEYASNQKLVAVIEFATETLTGIPSIIFGLVGMLFFLQLAGSEGRYPGRRPDPGDHDPAHHRPHHPGELENRAPVLPGGVPGSGRR